MAGLADEGCTNLGGQGVWIRCMEPMAGQVGRAWAHEPNLGRPAVQVKLATAQDI